MSSYPHILPRLPMSIFFSNHSILSHILLLFLLPSFSLLFATYISSPIFLCLIPSLTAFSYPSLPSPNIHILLCLLHYSYTFSHFSLPSPIFHCLLISFYTCSYPSLHTHVLLYLLPSFSALWYPSLPSPILYCLLIQSYFSTSLLL